MPTNEQRRATAKRKLERQLERRAKQARTRRILVISGGVIASLAVIAAVVATVVISNNDHKSKAAASSSTTAASSSPASSTPDTPAPQAAPMPPFQPSASVGANCQYPATPDQPAAKPVKPPHSGKVPTDPATESISMVTNQGHIGLLLANNESPCTVNNFVSLATQKFFDGTKCVRLTTSPDLAVLQCGDPKGDKTGGPGYRFANEYPTAQYPPNDPKLQAPVVYPRGTVAMANSGSGTNGSQFFLVYKDSQLPPQYTVFGKIQDDGLATLDKIAKGGVAGGGDDGTPATDVIIKSVLPD